MISEKDREAFLELVIPPLDYQLTYCLGTTFTMELPCLIQLALNANGIVKDFDKSSFVQDFDLITSFSEKACVFVQNCKIKSLKTEATKPLKIIKLLDGIVQEVPSVSRFGVFHPKVWFIRFDPINEKGEPVFKFFVMSRNLTTSLKWDISINVLGKPGKPSKLNSELSDFIKLLQSKSSLKKKKTPFIRKALKDLEQIEFYLPDGKLENMSFDFKWGREKAWNPINYSSFKKLIVVSPFLCKVELEKLSKLKDVTLVTTGKDLEKVAAFEELKSKTFVTGSGDLDLHAKIYMGLTDTETHIFAGSANCTNAAWAGDNVEANFQFHAPKKAFNDFYQSFIKDGDGKLRVWLEPFDSAYVFKDKKSTEEEFEDILDGVQNSLSAGEFHLEFRERDSLVTFEGDVWLPDGCEASVSILGTDESAFLSDVLKKGVRLKKVPLKDQTSFLRIELKIDGAPARSFYTVALSNFDRAERNSQIIGSSMTDWDLFYEYLGVLLDFEPKKIEGKTGSGGGGGSTSQTAKASFFEEHYLEKLLLKGTHDPLLIEKVDSALKGLESNLTPDKKTEFKKFKSLWVNFKQAFLEFKQHG